MLLILTLTALLFTASMSQITGYGNMTVDYGRDSKYGCAVANLKDVQQVTWQRLVPDRPIENLATYSKRFGEHVNNPYRGKVIFTEATLSSSSITLANVTWEDESCYICAFNRYPDGSMRKQICVTVQGISSFKTEVHAPSSDPEEEEEEDEEVVFSCSATGKPAPAIQWEIPSQATDTHRQPITTVVNEDKTFTSSSNVTLRLPAGWEGHVVCLLNSGAMGQRSERIPFSLPAREKQEEEGKTQSTSGTALVTSAVVSVTFIIIIIIVVVVVVIKRTRPRRPEERKMDNNDLNVVLM
ncbi:nectin-1-like [Notothenia coriiceps]|uniref:Nectin-1-like n=1 Tax=Notothenia coriiceps TaxID=8208 RepID=A0A6I9Q5W1_9TELE|nr:PREDICTED: nectin-1-like [Notothenia coriiceps]